MGVFLVLLLSQRRDCQVQLMFTIEPPLACRCFRSTYPNATSPFPSLSGTHCARIVVVRAASGVATHTTHAQVSTLTMPASTSLKNDAWKYPLVQQPRNNFSIPNDAACNYFVPLGRHKTNRNDSVFYSYRVQSTGRTATSYGT